MKRFIMTGAPGCGKTSILHALAGLGYAVVPEAATDVIAVEQARGRSEPWHDPLFTSAIVRLQEQRWREPVCPGTAVQVHDRSPLCTLALARYLGHPVTAELRAAIARITAGGLFERRVFFIRAIGFCQPTPARRISYQDSLVFERIHETEYLRAGFELVEIPARPVPDRAAMIDTYLRSWA